MKIQFPAVFAPLEEPARYKGAWGGRGSGKSHYFGGRLILRAATERVRAICLREVQLSIKDSVKQLLEDKIDTFGYGKDFSVLDQEIRGPHDSLIIFRGLKDMNAASIKSLEGFNVAWVEEAQTLSQRSLDLLIPTIREEGSELWFSWNPDEPTDPIDRLLRRRKPKNAVVVRANWMDNPFFPKALMEDMLRDKEEDPAKYEHVWMGEYRDTSDMQFISRELVSAARERELEPPTGPKIMGLDVARFGDDRTILVLRNGHRLERIWRWEKRDTMQTAGYVKDILDKENPDMVFVDGVGVGGGVVDRLRQLGVRCVDVNAGGRAGKARRYMNKRAEMWGRMRDWLRDTGCIPDDDELQIDLLGPMYEYDSQNRIKLEKKEDMKKRGLASPDLADALALTFAEPVKDRRMGVVPRIRRGGTQSEYNPLAGW